MESKDIYSNQTCSYLALRKAVGWIGILLPFVLLSGVLLVFNGKGILGSISLYYYSGMRDVFVGSICSIALFLFFYKGYDKWDNRAATLAGLFAVGIALFPTVEQKPYDWISIVHFLCASSFFLILAGYSMFLFTRKGSDPTRQKLIRNKIYIVCGAIMIACLAAILVFLLFFATGHPESTFVFWAETIALVAFGVSWLTKGGTLYPDKHAAKDKYKEPLMVLDHVAIWTNSLEELKDYYLKYFNATAGEKYINSKKHFESYFLSFKSGARLEIMKMPGIPNNMNDTVKNQHLGIIHLAFGVDTKDEVEVKVKQLESDGYKILSGPGKTGDGYYEFVTLDPDNNRIEVTVKF